MGLLRWTCRLPVLWWGQNSGLVEVVVVVVVVAVVVSGNSSLSLWLVTVLTWGGVKDFDR